MAFTANEFHLYISIDTGGSQTKIIYQFHTWEKPSYLLMPPGVEQISTEQLKRYQETLGWVGHPTAEQQAWLEWEDSIYVVGEFASKFAPQDRIKERKYENALYKVLAAIGVILDKCKVVSKKKLNIYLALVFPWNEYNDRNRFSEQLKLMFKSFKFRGESRKLSLSHFLCRPEGGGLAAIRIKQQGIEWLQSRNLAVLMFGHRNVSLIYLEKGTLKYGDSPLLGFSLMLDEVCSRVSGLEREQLASAIFKGIYEAESDIYTTYRTLHPKWINLKSIKALVTANNPTLREGELRDIAKSIEVTTLNYWETLKKWLDKNLPTLPNEVIIGGGAATFIEPELEAYFNCSNSSRDIKGRRPPQYKWEDSKRPHSDMFWATDIEKQIEQIFNLRYTHNEQYLTQRLIDSFGMLDQLKETIAEIHKAEINNAKKEKSP